MGGFFGTTDGIRDQRERAAKRRAREEREADVAARKVQAAAAEFVARAAELGIGSGSWSLRGVIITASGPPHAHGGWSGSPLDGRAISCLCDSDTSPNEKARDLISEMSHILMG